jgi:hypothetical protein
LIFLISPLGADDYYSRLNQNHHRPAVVYERHPHLFGHVLQQAFWSYLRHHLEVPVGKAHCDDLHL